MLLMSSSVVDESSMISSAIHVVVNWLELLSLWSCDVIAGISPTLRTVAETDCQTDFELVLRCDFNSTLYSDALRKHNRIDNRDPVRRTTAYAISHNLHQLRHVSSKTTDYVVNSEKRASVSFFKTGRQTTELSRVATASDRAVAEREMSADIVTPVSSTGHQICSSLPVLEDMRTISKALTTYQRTARNMEYVGRVFSAFLVKFKVIAARTVKPMYACS
ncbi:hypothetical protein ANN_20681 [Periplaneta americana]|uniref:Uncharacterized protein n=1 Tax=Periplaneta americana TaxID=6978 RepID=A0ABQ8SEK7_PERAM|nr:hypothetical protein ANN_20681 [Periplaneta americana]